MRTLLPTEQYPTPRCSIHAADINAYCATCKQLICPNCGLKDHKRHDVDLLEEIDENHRNQLKYTIANIKKNVKEWEDKCHTHDDSLVRELSKIEDKKLELLQSVSATFSTLIELVKNRHQEMMEKIIDVSSSQTSLVLEIQKLKSLANLELSKFDEIDTLPTFNIIEMKLNQLSGLNRSVAEMKSCFDNQEIENLHNFKVANVDSQAHMVLLSIQKLGEVISPQNNTIPTNQTIPFNTVPIVYPDVNMADVVIKVKKLTGGPVNKVKLDKFKNLDELKVHLKGLFKIQEDFDLVDQNSSTCQTLIITQIQQLKNREECYFIALKNY